MNTNIFFATIATAIIFTSCAQQEMLKPAISDGADQIEFEASSIENHHTETNNLAIFTGEFDFTEINPEEFLYGKFVIVEMFNYDGIYKVGRQVVTVREPELWIQTRKGEWIVNMDYAEARLSEAKPVIHEEGQAAEIYVFPYAQLREAEVTEIEGDIAQPRERRS